MAAQKELAIPTMTTFHSSSFGFGLVFLLGACNGRLIVVNRGGVGGADQAEDPSTDVVGSNAGSAGSSDNSGRQSCSVDSECMSNVCRAGFCQAPECDDGVQNGLETGVDCGGGRCHPCSTSCVCASSDALMVFGCDPRPDGPYISSIPQLSDDGNVVLLESSFTGNSQVYRWTAETGMRPLDGTEGGTPLGISGDGRLSLLLPHPSVENEAFVYRLDGTSVSTGLRTELIEHRSVIRMGSDGSVAGSVVDKTGTTTSLARWTESKGTEVLAALPAHLDSLSVLGVDSDATRIVGGGYIVGELPGGPIPIRWTDAGGLVLDLGALPAGANRADMRTSSRDATIVAGILSNDLADATNPYPGTFLWSAATGAVQIGDSDIPGYDANLSADGSTLAGIGGNPIYRWTADSGVVPLVLGQHPTGAVLLSADGNVLLVENTAGGDDALMMWDPEHGTRSVRTTLAAQGVDFSGWATIGKPLQLSSDGRVAVGYGTCGSRQAVYRIVLPN